MPNTKNFTTRLRLLDEMLSDRYHNYSIDDLTEKINTELIEKGYNTVSRRCIEKDINYIECDGPFDIVIERYNATGYNRVKQKSFTKRCLKYSAESEPIFKKAMSDDEKYLLSEAISLLGQFEGLPNLDALEQLRYKLNVSHNQKIISFSKNPLEGTSTLGELFTAISNKQVIEITYHTFDAPNSKCKFILYPYLLKEYNRRWFLIARDVETERLRNYGLDRINKVKPLPARTYIPYDGDINERFEDIIGVTLYEENKVEHILFWVSDNSKHYVATKPLHESQRQYSGNNEFELRKQYTQLDGGYFFSIDCIDNYELIRELTSFGADLVVLSPNNIQNEIFDKIKQMEKIYQNLRT